MSTPTTTIRVSVHTRDRLAAQAQQRGMSLSALLAEMASHAEREAIFRTERETTRAESTDDAVHAEESDWATTVDDGVT